jgi:hypothetical protein
MLRNFLKGETFDKFNCILVVAARNFFLRISAENLVAIF